MLPINDNLENMRAADKLLGTLEGLKLAVEMARKQSGECYAAGQDDDAEKYRALARMLKLKLDDLQKEYDDLYKLPGSLGANAIYDAVEDPAFVLKKLLRDANVSLAHESGNATYRLFYNGNHEEWWITLQTGKSRPEHRFSSPTLTNGFLDEFMNLCKL